jgi:hypothetical protein
MSGGRRPRSILAASVAAATVAGVLLAPSPAASAPTCPPAPPGAGNRTVEMHGASAATDVKTTGLTIARPAGTAVDDVLVAQVSGRTLPTSTPPAGWTLLDRTNAKEKKATIVQAVYWKRATAADVTTTAWTWDLGTTKPKAGIVIAYGGAQDVVLGAAGSRTSTAPLAPSLATGFEGRLLALFAVGAATPGSTIVDPPAGMAEQSETSAQNQVAVEAADQSWSASAATGDKTATTTISALAVGRLIGVRAAPAAVPSPTYSFANGADGGGVVSVIAAAGGTLVAGGDTQGIFRSVDGGLHWSARNGPEASVAGSGLLTREARRIAAVTPAGNGLWYAGAGNGEAPGGSGGFLASTDDGRTWVRRSSVPQFQGSNTGVALPNGAPHPRSTGRLIAVDPARAGRVYAGTFSAGILRSVSGGSSWETIALGGGANYVRSLVLDPSSAGNRAYAAVSTTSGSTVYAVNGLLGAVSTVTATPVPGAPTGMEELLALNGNLYAAGAGGVWRLSAGAWTQVLNGGSWQSIDGRTESAGDVLYVGTWAVGTTGNKIVRVDANGGHDAVSAPGTTVSYNVAGTSTEWWLARGHGNLNDPFLGEPDWMVDGPNYRASSILLVGDMVFAAGTHGVWRRAPAASQQVWSPAVRGLGLTFNGAVAADPHDGARVLVGDADRQTIVSGDGMQTVARNAGIQGTPGAMLHDYGLAVAWDGGTVPSAGYIGMGDQRVNRLGEVYRSPDPIGGVGWTSLQLAPVTTPPAQASRAERPVALAVGRVGADLIVLAAVEGVGVYRLAGGQWTMVLPASSGAGAKGLDKEDMTWVPGTSTVFRYDPASGAWRSLDAGLTWQQIWKQQSRDRGTGFLAAVPTDPTVLWVSTQSGLFRLCGVDVAGSTVENAGILAEPHAGVGLPGPVGATATGAVFVASRPDPSSGVGSTLYRSSDGGAHWDDVADNTYRAVSPFPLSISAGDRNVYVASEGNGVLAGARTSG